MKLIARSEGRNERHARIGVFQDGGKAGVLTVEASTEAEVLGLLNAGPKLLAACKEVVDFLAMVPEIPNWEGAATSLILKSRAIIAEVERVSP